MRKATDSAFVMPSVEREPRVFNALSRIRWVSFSNNVLGRFQASRLRVGIALLLSVLFWFGLFFLFFEGFNFNCTAVGNLITKLHEELFSNHFSHYKFDGLIGQRIFIRVKWLTYRKLIKNQSE